MTTASSARKPDGVGVALNPETSLERAVALAEAADLVLCTSIHPGLSGRELVPGALERRAELRRSSRSTCSYGMRVREDNWKVVRR